MIFLKKLVSVIAGLFLLLLIASFEKVIGLPIVFTTLFLVFFTNEQSFYRYIYLVFSSIFLALVYSFSFSLSLFLLVLLVLMTNYGNNIIANDVSRVLLSIYSFIAVIAVVSKISWSSGAAGYFIVGSLLIIVILMKTLFSKHGLAGRSMGRRSNFFK